MCFDQIPMIELLRYLCMGAGLKYSIEEKAVLINDDKKSKAEKTTEK